MSVPITLGKTVTTRSFSFMAMVIEAWGEEWDARDIAYEFTNGEKKQSTDTTNRGFYNGGAR
jgi:hypothetical protein